MQPKLGRGLDALISKSRDEDQPRTSDIKARLFKVEQEYSELKERTEALRKNLTMEIVMGSNPDMTQLRSMESRLLDLDLERKELMNDLPEPSMRTGARALSPESERKMRSSEIDMDMIKIMIDESHGEHKEGPESTPPTQDRLVSETDDILRDLRALQESHNPAEPAAEVEPLKGPDAGERAAPERSGSDPQYLQSIKNEIHPKVVLRKLKQEAGQGQAPQASAGVPVVEEMPVQTVKPKAFVKKRVVRKVKEPVIGTSGTKAELSELLRRTDVLIEGGSSEEALSLLEAGIGKFGSEGDQSILCQIGGIYFEKGDLDKSSERFRQVVRMNPFNARAINNLGVILKKQRRYEESIRIINQAIEVDPNYERAWFELGCVFMEIEPPLLKEASIFLKRALELDPRFERAREQLKACTERLRRPS